MTKSNNYKIAFYLVTILLILSLGTVSCIRGKKVEFFQPNTDVIASQDFFFSTEKDEPGMSTSVRGTVFVLGDENSTDRHIQIVSWVDIDENDIGGIRFEVRGSWKDAKVTSSYPDSESEIIVNKEPPMNETDTSMSVVSIGDLFFKGGSGRLIRTSGCVVADLFLDQTGEEMPEKLEMGIVVGGKMDYQENLGHFGRTISGGWVSVPLKKK